MAVRWVLFWFLFMIVHRSSIGVVHSALDAPYFVSNTVANLHQCHNFCVAHVACVSYNYDVVQRSCQLFLQTAVTSGKVVARRNSIYEVVTPGVSSHGPSGCDQRKCTEIEVCVSLPNDQHLCSPGPECPRPPVIPNSVQHVNASSVPTYHGTSLDYKCNPGFIAENGVSTITCGYGATWTSIVCKRPDCPSPPHIANSVQQFDASSVSTSYGTSLNYNCNPGFMAENGVSTITCGYEATWTSIVCKRIRSCREVRQCNSKYADGEFWIFPPPFGNRRAKIYCHNTLTSAPREFVSLPVLNIGYYPEQTDASCNGHEQPVASNVHGGKSVYSKIRVNIEKMEVLQSDFTFGRTVFGVPLLYGKAGDCYTGHEPNTRASCGPKGTFNLDTTDTGLVIDRTLEFPAVGFKPWGSTTRLNDGLTINLLCGGHCGDCSPSKKITLELYPKQEPPESSAVIPTC